MARGRLRIYLGSAPGVGKETAYRGAAFTEMDVAAVLARRPAVALVDEMAHGNIYAPDKVDAALSNYFRPGNLTALREPALLWVADRVDAYLRDHRAEHGISATWQARERIVVGLTGGPEGRTLIRRAARLASKGARGVNATQIVLGSSRRPAWQYVLGPGVGATVARESGPDLDVHTVTHDEVAKGRGLPFARGARPGRQRTAAGCRPGTARTRRSRPWTRARTTTSRSRSAWTSCSPASVPRYAGLSRRPTRGNPFR